MKQAKLLISALMVMTMLLGLSGTILAQEPQTQISGEITAITPVAGGYTVTILGEEGSTSNVFIPEDITIPMGDETLTPADLEVGWTLTVTVTQQEDGTLYVTSATVDDEGHEDEGEDETSEGWQHPVAARLAEYLGVDYQGLMAYYDSGVGFGLLARAYLLAQSLADEGITVEDVLAVHESGDGFGYFLYEYGLHPGKYNLGAVMSGKVFRWRWTKEKGEPPGHARRESAQQNKGMPPGQQKKNGTDQSWTPPGQAKKDQGKNGH